MGRNLYGSPKLFEAPGRFWRCRHGRSVLQHPCARCGLWHPWIFVQDWVTWKLRR